MLQEVVICKMWIKTFLGVKMYVENEDCDF